MVYLTAVLPLVIGFVLDFLLGDPYWLPHPVRLTGRLISKLETVMRRKLDGRERFAGTLLAIIVVIVCGGAAFAICLVCYRVTPVLGIIAEGIICYYLVAARCLKVESMKVFHALEEKDTERARKAVSMIVGRDTEYLDREGIIKAAVETVAENASDGVTAPMFWIALGGAPLGMLYKTVNTMDSMIGYKNERYIDLGRFAAKLDDVLNFIPSRITALIMILSAYITGLDGKKAYSIWKRDRFNHASPNSAQTEAVCAGALNIQLAGDAYYFGKLCRKKTIGNDDRRIENEDIRRANRLMYCTSVIMLILCTAVRAVIFGGFYG